MDEDTVEAKAIETCPYLDDLESYADGFINGAEYGYNKANGYAQEFIDDFTEYAKVIIQDLLNNSDEYARQRAIDFLKEN